MYLESIKKLVERVPGATGCIMVDNNGEEIVVYAKDNEYQMKLLGAHMVPIHKRLEAISQRIDSGDFGDCQGCGEPIAVARLELDPATRLCIGCASEAEKA